jgi:dipeptidyl aminopeptidase/acylaminoacyl peptidase
MAKHLHLFIFIFLTSHFSAWGQTNKRPLEHEDTYQWESINTQMISNDGRWVVYSTEPYEGNQTLHIYDGQADKTTTFERSQSPRISHDSKYVAFTIKADEDTLKALKRKKVKKKDLPKDTLGIYNLTTGQLEKVPGLLSFQMPEKWSGWLAYHIEKEIPRDTTDQKSKDRTRKDLVILNLDSNEKTVVPAAKDFTLSEEGGQVLVHSSGEKGETASGIYLFDANSQELKPLYRAKGDYAQLTFDEKGEQLAFMASLDTTKQRIPPFALFHYQNGLDSAQMILDNEAEFIPENWRLSEKGDLQFSEDQSKLFFGIAPDPVLQDTSLLEDEIVNVEVWSYTDNVLYTEQEARADREKNRSYLSVFHIADNKAIQLAHEGMPEVSLGDEANARYAIGYNDRPYAQLRSWVGDMPSDIYRVDVNTGEAEQIYEKEWGSLSLSPKGKYAIWYHPLDSAYYTLEMSSLDKHKIADKEILPVYDELNDVPMPARSYGIAGWTKDDQAVLIYDRYDIWKVDPVSGTRKNLTNYRDKKVMSRYIRVDREERSIDDSEPLLIFQFDETNKQTGYYWLDANTGKKTLIQLGDFYYSSRVTKAQDADAWMYTRQSYQVSPNIFYGDDIMATKQITNTNPQQADFLWSNIELYKWTSLDGQEVEGLLIKPENFDPNKKYPMMVYFYERSSDGLNRYQTVTPSGAVIRPAFYASRGYVVFIPDIPYRVGYPGESCYNSVIAGVSSLINEGFIDRENIGVQGHSWGGYQDAYLITKSDIFKCAESGAPVVNMTSAYGGIRWGTGMSRMFQYEKTQSRIGGTLWEKPIRYIENSPLFFADKINTPVLILHNDEDTAVPWYQGIEFFVAMRRLGKPAWLLNYNGEPHGLRKKQNQKDFAKRMQQFFDHYLKGDPMPMWMKEGVPAIEKGINQGMEFSDSKN